jgi:hypothetical protein
MRRRRTPEVIAGRVNSDGSIAAATDPRITTAKFGTGAYTVTLPPDFRLVTAVATTNNSASWTIEATVGSSGFQVNIYASSTAAAGDASFNFVAVGAQQ